MFRLLRPPQMEDPRAWVAQTTYRLATSVQELQDYLGPAMEAGTPVGADCETKLFNAWVKNPAAGWSFSTGPNSAIYAPVGHEVGHQHNLPLQGVLDTIVALDQRCDTYWHNYGLYDGPVLVNTYGIELTRYHDVLHMVWLYNCELLQKGLKQTAQHLFGVTMPRLSSLLSDDDVVTIVDRDPSDPDVLTYVGADADFVRRIAMDRRVVEKVKQQQAVYDLERVLIRPFMRTMQNGCYLHDGRLADVEHQIGNFTKGKNGKILTPIRPGSLMERYDRAVREALAIGPEVNLNSGDQMEPIFLKAGIPLDTKTDSGKRHSVSTKVINAFAKDYPAVEAYIAWVKLEALDRNYVRKLRAAYRRFGSHVRFPLKQYGAPTGRMACGGDKASAERMAEAGYVNVNIQSLPDSEKEDYLPDIRCAIAADDPDHPDPDPWSIVSIDYSQLQLRIAANWSREPRWVETYTTYADDPERNDLHMNNARFAKSQPAAPRFVPDPKRPGATMDNPIRKLGKTMNFAVLFQAGEETTAKAGKMPVAEAKRALDNFWAAVPVLSSAIEAAKRRAKTEKVSKTWLGRQRPLAHYFAPDANRAMQALGEREAINHPIQGGEADLFKIAAVKVDRMLTARDWHAHVRVCLYMHDEIVFRVRTRMVDEVVPALLDTMESVKMPGCPVPFVCDAGVGPDWGNLTPWERPPKSKAAEASRPVRPAGPSMPVPPATSFARRA